MNHVTHTDRLFPPFRLSAQSVAKKAEAKYFLLLPQQQKKTGKENSFVRSVVRNVTKTAKHGTGTGRKLWSCNYLAYDDDDGGGAKTTPEVRSGVSVFSVFFGISDFMTRETFPIFLRDEFSPLKTTHPLLCHRLVERPWLVEKEVERMVK